VTLRERLSPYLLSNPKAIYRDYQAAHPDSTVTEKQFNSTKHDILKRTVLPATGGGWGRGEGGEVTMRIVKPRTPSPWSIPEVPDLPPNAQLVTEKPLTLDFDTFMYASDFHAPLHNRRMTERLIRVGRQRAVKNLVIGGDLFDFDSLSTHPKTLQTAGLSDTLETAALLLLELAKDFSIWMLPGNHDERVAKRLNEPTEYARVVWGALKGRQPKHPITITTFPWLYIGPEETGWTVGHPTYFSTVPARMGADVAMLEHRNVIGAHNHVVGLMQSRCGRYFAIDPGHMTEPELTPYYMKNKGLSKYPRWKAGFVLVRRNIPTMMVEGLVDWQEYAAA
jgi:hypothetical protein